VSARWRKWHEQDRQEHQCARLERFDEDAADRGEGKADVAEPRRLPHDGALAVVEDDFVSFAHRGSSDSRSCGAR
jgi:hypothetical protein